MNQPINERLGAIHKSYQPDSNELVPAHIKELLNMHWFSAMLMAHQTFALLDCCGEHYITAPVRLG